MKNIFSFKDKVPKIHGKVYIDPMARIVGDVEIGEESYIGFGAIVRADENKIKIGKKVVILENVIIEAPEGELVEIGSRTLVSHGAIVHGAKIGKNVLIGIGSIVLDRAEVGDGSIIAAGAVVPPNHNIPSRSLALGVPAKVIRNVTEQELKHNDNEIDKVIKKAKIYRNIFK